MGSAARLEEVVDSLAVGGVSEFARDAEGEAEVELAKPDQVDTGRCDDAVGILDSSARLDLCDHRRLLVRLGDGFRRPTLEFIAEYDAEAAPTLRRILRRRDECLSLLLCLDHRRHHAVGADIECGCDGTRVHAVYADDRVNSGATSAREEVTERVGAPAGVFEVEDREVDARGGEDPQHARRVELVEHRPGGKAALLERTIESVVDDRSISKEQERRRILMPDEQTSSPIGDAMKSLEGRVAVVTGAANGVGRGIAEVLASEGAAVVALDVDLEAAQRVADSLSAGAIAIQSDVADPAAMDAAAADLLEHFGRVDILAANAGIYPTRSLADMQDSDWDRVMAVNVKGAVHAIQVCVPSMQQQRYGRIVLTSSITGPIVGAPNLSHYAASKAAMLGLMRSAALEFVGDGITVNAVQPGNVRTAGIESFGEEFIAEMVKSIPMGRLASPADIGWAVRFLASEEAAYITGQTIVIDGGQVLPEGGIEAEA